MNIYSRHTALSKVCLERFNCSSVVCLAHAPNICSPWWRHCYYYNLVTIALLFRQRCTGIGLGFSNKERCFYVFSTTTVRAQVVLLPFMSKNRSTTKLTTYTSSQLKCQVNWRVLCHTMGHHLVPCVIHVWALSSSQPIQCIFHHQFCTNGLLATPYFMLYFTSCSMLNVLSCFISLASFKVQYLQSSERETQ